MGIKGIIKLILTGIAIGLALAFFITLLEVVNGRKLVFNLGLAYEVSIYMLYTVVLSLINGIYFDYLNHRVKWGNTKPLVRVFLGALGGILLTMTGIFIIRIFTNMVLEGENWSTFIATENVYHYTFSFVITVFITVVFHAVYFYRELQRNKIKEQKIIAGTASAQFDALKNQLDPHFLFNSLNVLTSLIEENPDAAQRFTTSLSKVYRYVLEQKNKELVTVDEELKFARTFVNLLKMRFEDSLVFDIPDTASNPEAKVVPLSLQLLLENAVKHNMVTSQKPLHIKIFERDGNLVVSNNLQPKAVVKKSSGVGLRNIKSRYGILTKREVIITQTGTSFEVAIPMLTKLIHTATESSKKRKMENSSYIRAKKRVDNLREFYQGLLSYLIVIPFLAYINYRTGWEFQWFWFAAFGWGVGLAFHAFKVFAMEGGWEERKIQELMEKERDAKKWK